MFLLSTTRDLWYLAASICLVLITLFLCWALYELIKLLRQTDEMVTETRARVNAVEQGVVSIVEKMTSAVGHMGLLAEGGKQLLSLFTGKKSKERGGALSAKGKQKLLEVLAEESDEE